MADHLLCDEASVATQSETDIRHLFSCQVKLLFIQKWKIADEMTEWSKWLVQQIHEYASEQRKLLDEEYEKKLLYLNSVRDKVLERALLLEQKKDTEQIHQLLDKCSTLKIELATLIYIERPISSIQLIAEGQLLQKKHDESNVHKPDNEQSENKQMEDHNNGKMNRTETNINSSPNPTITSARETNLQSSRTRTISDEEQATVNNHELESDMSSRDQLAEKCPICYMIFPLSMSASDRHEHANEHYAYD